MLFVGDSGTVFRVTLVRPTERDPKARMRLDRSEVSFLFESPDGTVTALDGVIADVQRGVVTLALPVGLIDLAGQWRWQVLVVETADDDAVIGRWHTEKRSFTVDDPLAEES